MVWCSASGQLDCSDAEAPDVGLVVVPRHLLHHFGRHPARRSNKCVPGFGPGSDKGAQQFAICMYRGVLNGAFPIMWAMLNVLQIHKYILYPYMYHDPKLVNKQFPLSVFSIPIQVSTSSKPSGDTKIGNLDLAITSKQNVPCLDVPE